MRRGGQLALRKRDLGMPVVKAARRVRVRLRRLLSSPLRRARVAFPPGVVRALALVCVGGSCGLLAEHLAAWSCAALSVLDGAPPRCLPAPAAARCGRRSP
jgi:hypothetical protein